jgi:soluble lytic murein transglycosylase-like protein
MIARSDIAAVEYRVAQLSEADLSPVAANASDAAFHAALSAQNAGSGRESATVAPASAPRIVPNDDLERIIAHACTVNGVDPALVKAVVANESGFDAAATSNAGAQGLMQLMPATAASLGVSDAYDARQNVAGGTRYLRSLLERFGGNVPLALAAYNAGPGAVERGAVGTQTQDYVRSVLVSYSSYQHAT